MSRATKNIFAFISSQIVGFAFGLYFESSNILIHSIISMIVCGILGGSSPWIVCSGLIPFSLILPHIPSWIPFVIFIFLVIIFLPTVWTRVPFYPTFSETLDRISLALSGRNVKSFVDIGSGFGHVGLSLSKKFPETHFYGYELGLLPWSYSRIFSKKNTTFLMKNFWKVTWKDFDVVYVFLSPEPMERVYEKFITECSDDALLISNSFIVPNVIPDKVLEGHQNIYIYTKGNAR